MALFGSETCPCKSCPQEYIVYWMVLAHIPSSVINELRKRLIKFLWLGGGHRNKLHLTSWKKLSLPKAMGRWGIKSLFWFSEALSLKILWRGLFVDVLWKDILHAKYMKQLPLIQWIRFSSKYFPNASNF